MISLKKILYVFLFIALFGSIGWYAYAQSENLIQGPRIEIESPENGSTANDPLVKITGSAENISHIRLNDRPIFIDDEGRFSEVLLLLPGYNIIEITARDRFERTTSKKLELVFQQ